MIRGIQEASTLRYRKLDSPLTFPFTKASGAGNDFIIIDGRNRALPSPRQIELLCDRNQIGADGVLLLLSSEKGDVQMKIFNADGSEAAMCGNGLRCFKRYLDTIESLDDPLSVEVGGQLYSTSTLDEQVTVELQPASYHPHPLLIDNQQLHGSWLNTGVPHWVMWVEDLDLFPLSAIAPAIRFHPDFAPEGVNVTLASWVAPRHIRIRTYERGVEGETLACGTGAAAAALAGASEKNIERGPMEVTVLSQERLTIDFLREKQFFSKIYLAGPADLLFHGTCTFFPFEPSADCTRDNFRLQYTLQVNPWS